jgi:hypothetical protein
MAEKNMRKWELKPKLNLKLNTNETVRNNEAAT